MASLSSLPSDIIVDNILPLLSVKDFLRFSATCKAFHSFSTDEVYWRKLTASTFRLPAQPLRQQGWKELYKNLAKAKIFTWGSNQNNRLGHSLDQRRIAVPLETPTPKNEVVVDIVAGGWSITVLTASGALYTWGALGEFSWSAQQGPVKLCFPATHSSNIAQVSSGRSHILGLSDKGVIWQWNGNAALPGRFIKFLHVDTRPYGSSYYSTGRIKGTVQKVAAGWGHSVALVNGVGLVVWWTVPESANNEEGILVDGEVIPETYCIEQQGRSSSSREQCLAEEIGEVIDFMAGEGFLVFLTKSGKVFAVDTRSPGAVAGIRPTQLKTFSAPAGQNPMCYISGSFRKFAVFNNDGLVYIGTKDIVLAALEESRNRIPPAAIGNQLNPIIMSSLQRRGIVAIAFGDYHSLALTSQGKVLAWGIESRACGCLGLGPVDMASERGVDYTRLDGYLEEPTVVKFDLATEDLEYWKQIGRTTDDKTFVFNITAAGWHSGALALTPDEPIHQQSSSGPDPVQQVSGTSRIPHHGHLPGEAGHGGGQQEGGRSNSVRSLPDFIPSPFISHDSAMSVPGSRPHIARTGGPLLLGPNDRLSPAPQEAQRQARMSVTNPRLSESRRLNEREDEQEQGSNRSSCNVG